MIILRSARMSKKSADRHPTPHARPLPWRSEACWAKDAESVTHDLDSSAAGLTSAEAAQRQAEIARIDGRAHHAHPTAAMLARQFTSPIILLLLAAAVISFLVSDAIDGAIVIAIVVLSGLLGFWQEHRAGSAVSALMARVAVTATVHRDGQDTEVPLTEIVPGDVVELSAGSIIPADGRLLTSDQLLVDESALTGESFPVEKVASGTVPADASLAARRTAVFQGGHVVSGTARMMAVATGTRTEFGQVSKSLTTRTQASEFQQGLAGFGRMLLRIMVVLTVFILVVNTVLGRSLIESLMFALALAIGLTPQMLPAITSVSLATGARKMAERQVIVKRLSAIEDLGSVQVLCTDKTGTITQGAAQLDRAEAISTAPAEADALDADVLQLALVNAGGQRGFANPLDQAVLARGSMPEGLRVIGEVPYDFTRRRLSVAVIDAHAKPGASGVLVCKGAFDQVLSCCTNVRQDGHDVALDTVREPLQRRFEQLSSDGYRVLAIATGVVHTSGDDDQPAAELSVADEQGLTLRGLLCFHDPVKDDVLEDITGLHALGVTVKVITGDNRFAAGKVARDLGLDAADVVTGPQLEKVDDGALQALVQRASVFAEVEPTRKARIVTALRAGTDDTGQHTAVAFLGDGINDAPALHAADVGISVDTAHEVARDAAAVVLLDKSLGVILDGVRLGRETFANTLKYVRVTTSASFGNMISMAFASLFLPFLPMLPRQVLVLNFLTDLPSMAIASDRVDDELVERPGRWRIGSIRTFMIVFGVLSALFDIITFGVLMLGFGTDDTMFRSAWFIESTLTELAVLFSMRTARPILRSRPGRGLLVLSLVVAVITLALPYSPVAGLLGIDDVPWPILGALVVITVVYVAANELLKRRFILRQK